MILLAFICCVSLITGILAKYEEKLVLKGLEDGKVLAHFQFINQIDLGCSLDDWKGIH